MSKYRIHAFYRTGDSFGSEDVDRILEMEWSNLDLAKEAIKRITQHYKWYESNNNSYRADPDALPEPEWHKGLYESCLKVKMDDGNEVQFHAPWCGYFERLRWVEIVTPKEDWMKVEFE